MAATAIWDIRGRLDHVLDYAENPEKTKNPDWDKENNADMADVMEEAMRQAQVRGLADVIEYATEDAKTEQQYFVSSINCAKQTARKEMILTKKQWKKEDGIAAYHGYQSFAPGEGTPELAHKIGVELARRLWGDRFEVIVATHLNAKCIHNHFVLNSVSFKDGKRYYDNKASYALMRRTSDELCREYSLSVIQPKYAGQTKHYVEWKVEQEGRPTWRSTIRGDVDKAVMAAMSFPAFLRALRDMGYEVKTGVKHMAVRPPGKERFVRLRSLGPQYTEEAIRMRILRQQKQEYAPAKQTIPRRRYLGLFVLSHRITWRGLRALYYYYLHKLRQAPHVPSAPYLLREDLRQIDKLSGHAKFLNRYKIETLTSLEAHKARRQKDITALLSERTDVRNERRRTNTTPERDKELSGRLREIASLLGQYRKEVRLCGEIPARAARLRETIQNIHAERKKEMMKHEPFRRRGGSGREHDGTRR